MWSTQFFPLKLMSCGDCRVDHAVQWMWKKVQQFSTSTGQRRVATISVFAERELLLYRRVYFYPRLTPTKKESSGGAPPCPTQWMCVRGTTRGTTVRARHPLKYSCWSYGWQARQCVRGTH